MNPNQPPQRPDQYLDTIAAQAQPPKLAPLIPRKVMYGGGIAIIVAIILLVAGSIFGSSQRGSAEVLLARLNATQPIVTDAQSKLRSSQLRSLNSGLSIYFTNTLRDSAEPFSNVGVEADSLPTNVVEAEAEATTVLTERLEDARLNAIYDRTYALEMDYRLATIMTLMQETYNSTSNEELRIYLTEAYDNLETTQQAFADFNEGS
jgi:hypothetical protein